MTVMVALLRGVNVGSKNALPMAELRAMAESLGYSAIRTYIQSGNLIVDAGRTKAATVESKLAAAVSERMGRPVEVHVRTKAELDTVLDANPFLADGADPAHLHVTFTSAAAGPALGTVDLERYAPEAARAVGRELYLHLPGGVGRSKLAADLAKLQRASGTTRNWKTVTTLAELAELAELPGQSG